MTCIVGYVDTKNKRVILGGDSAGVDTHTLGINQRSDTKVFRNGDFILGFTSSFRMGQILRYHAQLPTPDTWDIDKFMCTQFVDAVRDAAVKAGWSGKDPEGREIFGTFLVGYQDRLYAIYDDLQVGINSCGYASVGCGQDFSMGALLAIEALALPSLTPEVKVVHALNAAVKFSAGVQPPYTLMDTKGLELTIDPSKKD